MGGDYPDYTDVMAIIASEIMLPMDVQAAYIMMPIDIQAQYINVGIDIKAQTIGKIKVDIKAQSLDKLNINIAAQTMGNITVAIASAVTLNVDIGNVEGPFNIKIGTAQTVAVYDSPEWEGKVGNDLDIDGFSENIGSGAGAYVIDKAVTATTAWVIHSFGVVLMGLTGTLYGYIWDDTDNAVLAASGGTQGFSVVLPKPVRVPRNHTVKLIVYHYGDGAGDYYGVIQGYEE